MIGMSDRDQLHLQELMLTDHAARILARRAGLRAETRRQRRETPGQRRFIDDLIGGEVGERHLGGGDQP
jgi:hypothetical protein